MLQGKRILIVEDEAILALDLCNTIEDMGAAVIGPCSRLRAAMKAADVAGIDGAVLDIDLAGEAVFPLADRLVRANVPIVFHTGRHDTGEINRRYAGAGVCPKPAAPERIAQALVAVMGRPN